MSERASEPISSALPGARSPSPVNLTRISAEPHSGAPLFHMEARLRLPPNLDAGAVQAALEDISGEIIVDIALTPSEAA